MIIEQTNQKKKILIDLDIVTVAKWDKQDQRKEQAQKLLQRVENKEFEIITPRILLELVSKWKNEPLRLQIEQFYYKNSEIIGDWEVIEKVNSSGTDFEKTIEELNKNNIKWEDSFLILTASVYAAILVTFNRKHLSNNKEKINEILEKFNLPKIEITQPHLFSTAKTDFFNFLYLSKTIFPIPLFISSASSIGSTFAGIKASSPSFFNPFLFPINIPSKKPINAFRFAPKKLGA